MNINEKKEKFYWKKIINKKYEHQCKILLEKGGDVISSSATQLTGLIYMYEGQIIYAGSKCNRI
jgi:hypothetical protein